MRVRWKGGEGRGASDAWDAGWVVAGLDAGAKFAGGDEANAAVAVEVVGSAVGAIAEALAGAMQVGGDVGHHAIPGGPLVGVDVVVAGSEAALGGGGAGEEGEGEMGDACDLVEHGGGWGPGVDGGTGTEDQVIEDVAGAALFEAPVADGIGRAEADFIHVAEVRAELKHPSVVAAGGVLDAGEAAAMIGGVEVKTNADLAEVGGTAGTLSGKAHLAHHGDDDGRQNANDGDDSEQLNQRKAMAEGGRRSQKRMRRIAIH